MKFYSYFIQFHLFKNSIASSSIPSASGFTRTKLYDDDIQFVATAESKIRKVPGLIPISTSKNQSRIFSNCLNTRRLRQQDFCNRNMAYSGSSNNSILGLNHNMDSKKKYGSLLKSMIPDLYCYSTPKTEDHSLEMSYKRSNDFSMERDTRQMKINGLYDSRSLQNEEKFIGNKSTTFIDISDDEDIPESFRDMKNNSMKNVNRSSSSFNITKESAKVPLVKPVNSMLERTERKECFKGSVIEDICRKFSESRRKNDNEICLMNRQIQELSLETHQEEKLQQKRIDDVITNLGKTVVIDEEDEVIDEYVALTKEQLALVNFGLRGGRGTDKLIDKFSFSITRHDIQTLDGLNWLNDEVINFYMELLKERSAVDESLPKVHAMNTFFVPKLMSSGFQGVRRWTRKINIFDFDIIPVPVHVGGVHWCMAIINMREKWIRYYDSMGQPNARVLEALRRYLEEESLDKRKIPFDTSDWIVESVRDCPQQRNGRWVQSFGFSKYILIDFFLFINFSDCGVFSCMFAEFACRESDISFDQSRMPYFRNKMIVEIIQGKLLL